MTLVLPFLSLCCYEFKSEMAGQQRVWIQEKDSKGQWEMLKRYITGSVHGNDSGCSKEGGESRPRDQLVDW